MKTSIENKASGAGHQIKGKIKEVAGRATNNPDLEAEGTIEKAGGAAERKLGDVKKVFGH